MAGFFRRGRNRVGADDEEEEAARAAAERDREPLYGEEGYAGPSAAAAGGGPKAGDDLELGFDEDAPAGEGGLGGEGGESKASEWDRERARKAREQRDLEARRREELREQVRAAQAVEGRWLRHRLMAIPRSGLAAQGMEATSVIITFTDFENFLHRGLDVEGHDLDEVRVMYLGLVQSHYTPTGMPIGAADIMSVEDLATAIEKGQWTQMWRKYAATMRRKAFELGNASVFLALTAICAEDPLAQLLPPKGGALVPFPTRHLKQCLWLVTLPLTAPLSACLPPAGQLMRKFKFFLLSRLMRKAPLLGTLVFYAKVLPVWLIGALVTLYYGAYQPDFLLADVVGCLFLLGLLVSLVAALLETPEGNARRPIPPRSSAAATFDHTHAFPGGRPQLPDDQSRLVQTHPRMDSLRHAQGGAKEDFLVGADGTRIPRKRAGLQEKDGNSNGAEKKENKPALHWVNRGNGGERPATASKLDDSLRHSMDSLLPEPRLVRKLPKLPATLDRVAREEARATGGKKKQTDALFFRPVTERDIAEQVLLKSEAAAAEWVAAQRGLFSTLSVLLVAFLLALIPAMHRLTNGRKIFGGAVKNNFCVESMLPAEVLDSLGFGGCHDQPAENVVKLQLSNSTLTATGFLGVVVDSSLVGSTAGIVITVGTVLWGTSLTFALLALCRRHLARLYEHAMRWRYFNALVHPGEAAAYEVPYVNLRHAWLPWLRVRLYLLRLRKLELQWEEEVMRHLAAAIAALVASACVVWFVGFHSDTVHVSSWVPSALALASVLGYYLLTFVALGSNLQTMFEDHGHFLTEEKWKLDLDAAGGVSDRHEVWQMHNTLTDLRDMLKKRDEAAPLVLFGAKVKQRRAACHALAALALGLFLVYVLGTVLSAAASGPSLGDMKAFLDASFAYTHSYHEEIIKRINDISGNTTSIRGTVEASNIHVTQLQPNLQKETYDMITGMHRCMNCTRDAATYEIPEEGIQGFQSVERPAWTNFLYGAVSDAMVRSYYEKIPPLEFFCPEKRGTANDHLNRDWCFNPGTKKFPLQFGRYQDWM